MSFKGQHVVIVGGSSGIGRALAQNVLAQGAEVTIISRSEDKLKAANKDYLQGKAKTLAFNAGDPEEAEKGYGSLGKINHFVTTAAALSYGPVSSIALEAVTDMLHGKFWAPLLAARFAAPKIVEGGSLTFFTGIAADRPMPGSAIVSAINAGLEGLARALSVELAPLRVNALSPGVTETAGWDFMPEADRKGFFEHMAKTLPARHVGSPADIAEAAVTLMTNKYITGSVLHVDGGGRLV